MTSWTPLDPGIGDLASLSRYAQNLLDLAEALDQRARSINDALLERPTHWTGPSAEAWDAMIRPEIDAASTLATTFRTRNEAVLAYASSLRNIKADVAQNLATAHRSISLGTDNGITTTRDTQSGHYTCAITPTRALITPEQLPVLEAQLRSTQSALNGHAQDLDAIAARRRLADNTLGVALERPASWAAQHAAYTAMGLTDPLKMSKYRLTEAFIQDLDGLNLGEANADIRERDAQKINDFYDAFGGDPAVMSQLYSSLGGARINNLLLHLERSSPDPGDQSISLVEREWALDTARRIRDGFTLGSQGWDEHQARAFAESFFGLPAHPAPVTGAFLFDGREPLGENIAYALAEALDRYERIGGHGGAFNGSRALTPLERGRDDLFAADTAAAIFQQLAHHPEKAANFLNPDNFGDEFEARTKYWFAQRTWKDGLQAVTALALGTQKIPGGPLDTPPTPEGLRQAAGLAGQAMRLIDFKDKYGGVIFPGATSDNMSEFLAINLPGFMDGTLAGKTTGNFGFPFHQNEFDPDFYSPNIGQEDLGFWLGIAGQTAAGSTLLDLAYHKVNTTWTRDAVGVDPALGNDLIERLVQLRRLLDVNQLGTLEKFAGITEAHKQQARDRALSLLSLIPMGPSALVAKAVGTTMVKGVSTAVVKGGAATLIDATWGASKIKFYDAVDLGSPPPGLTQAQDIAAHRRATLALQEQYRIIQYAQAAYGYTPTPLPDGDQPDFGNTTAMREWVKNNWQGCEDAFQALHPRQNGPHYLWGMIYQGEEENNPFHY